MPSVYDENAPKLTALGYHPLPIGPGTQHPQHYVPSLQTYENTVAWQNHKKPIETSPQPSAGIGIRLGVQSDGSYLVGTDWDYIAAANVAMEAFPDNLIAKVGSRGFTGLFRSTMPVPSRDFKIRGLMSVQVLSEGKQTVIPPTIHAKTGNEYTWSGLWHAI